MDPVGNYHSAMTYKIEHSRKQLEKAVKIVGSETELAALLSQKLGRKIRQSHVQNWLKHSKKMPSELCIPIEEITQKKVMRWQIRPDLWPEKNCRELISAMG